MRIARTLPAPEEGAVTYVRAASRAAERTANDAASTRMRDVATHSSGNNNTAMTTIASTSADPSSASRP